jgi:hypothetical protein
MGIFMEIYVELWGFMWIEKALIISGWWVQTCFIFHFMYGMSSFPLTNSISFQDGHIAPPTSESSGYFRNVNGNFTLWEYGKMPSEAGWVVQLHLTI